jgi:hypothetical protein
LNPINRSVLETVDLGKKKIPVPETLMRVDALPDTSVSDSSGAGSPPSLRPSPLKAQASTSSPSEDRFVKRERLTATDLQDKLPDLRFINRYVPIADIARSLDLKFGSPGTIHCWRPDRHQHQDRTPSVGIQRVSNKVRCFVCDEASLGPIDLVMNVLSMGPREAGIWIAQRFPVKSLPKRRENDHVERDRYGFESDLGLLIRSGLWSKLCPAARCIATVFVEFKKEDNERQLPYVRMSYKAIARYSGIASPNSISKALKELAAMGWLRYRPFGGSGLIRKTTEYELTPHSDELRELANAEASEFRRIIEAERQMRAAARGDRVERYKRRSIQLSE